MEVLPYLNIPMTEPITEAELEELNEKGIYTAKYVIKEETTEVDDDISDEMTGDIIEPANNTNN